MSVTYQPLTGGILMGCSATILLICNGRIAGISGIISGIYTNSGIERTWRILFLISLASVAGIAFHFYPASRPHRIDFPIWILILSGLLVGFGSRMGSGCTSGHGVCGLGRLSLRSLVAVLVFMGMAIATVAVTHHLRV